MTRSIPWPRILAEGLAIVVSILLAFGIQAWWDGRQDRVAEEAHLRALQADLAESKRLLGETSLSHSRTRSSLVSLLEEDLDSYQQDSVATWVGVGLFQLHEYVPSLTALTDLSASDQLGLLAPEVRRQVSVVNRALADLARADTDLKNAQEGLVDPFVVTELPLTPVLSAGWDLGISETLGTSPDWSPLSDTEARNRMTIKLTLVGTVSSRQATLREEFDSLAAVIEARLAELS